MNCDPADGAQRSARARRASGERLPRAKSNESLDSIASTLLKAASPTPTIRRRSL